MISEYPTQSRKEVGKISKMSTKKECVVGGLPIDIESLSCPPSAFSEVAFSVTGSVDAKITSLLESGGAKQRTYTGVATTHLIAGEDADEMKMDEAKDIFEVPVVVPEWAALSLKLGKILAVDGFERHYKKLFSSIVVSTSGIKGKDLVTVWALVTYYGGEFRKHLTSKCTHLISNQCSGKAYQSAKDKGLKIVCSDWVTECIKCDSIIDEAGFNPALILPLTQSNVTPTTLQQTVVPPPSVSLVKGPVVSNTFTSVPAVPKPATPITSSANTPVSVNANQYNQYTMVRPQGGVPHQQNILQNQLLTSQSSPIRQGSPVTNTNPVVNADHQLVPRLRFENLTIQSPTQHHHSAGDPQHVSSPNIPQGQSNFHRVTSPGNIHTSQAQGNQHIIQGVQHIPGKPQQFTPPQQMTAPSQMGPPQSPQQTMPNTPGQQTPMMQKLTPPSMNSTGQNNPMLTQGQVGMPKIPNQLNLNQAHHPGSMPTHPSGSQVQSPQGIIHGQQISQPQNNSMQGSPSHQLNQGHNQGTSMPNQIQQQQMIQSPGPFQSPSQQMIRSPVPQMIQGQHGQQMIQSPGQQIHQGQQQMIQSPGHQQIQMIQSPGQQMIQSPGQQMIHSPGQQLIPGQGQMIAGQQMMQGQPLIQNQGQQMLQGVQQMNQNQGQQHMIQNQQMIQSQGSPMIGNQQIMMQQQRPQQPMQSPGPQQTNTMSIMANQQQQQLPQGQPPQQQMMQTHQMQQGPPHQFQQMQYQSQGIQQFQPQQKPQGQFNNQMQQQRPHMMQNQQLRFSLQQSPQPQSQNQQQGHFQVIPQSQQSPNSRPQLVMGQMQNRGQFQPMQGQNIQNATGAPMGQQMYRQQQMQMFHPIQQQQRLQSPPLGSQQQAGSQGPPQQQQNQLQQSHMNQGQMMSPQQGQGPPQHYSVVITHQQFQQGQNPHGQQLHQQQNASSPVQMQQQRVQFQSRPGSPAPSWTPQQQMEIIQQIQSDPQIRAQWSRMDNAQRQLLMQKLAQRKREDQLRDMLLRQQHMTQGQPLGSQSLQQVGQQQQPTQLSASNQVIGNSQQQHIPPQGQSEMMKPLMQQQPILHPAQGGVAAQGGVSPTAVSGQHSPHQMSMGQQQQILVGQHPQDIHNKGPSPMSHPNQLGIQNHQHQQLLASQQQKVVNSQMSPNNQQQQRFLTPAPVHSRPHGHGVIGASQQSPNSGLVRTQIFTPQVAQQNSQVRIHHVLIQPGQTRPPSQVGMQQQLQNQQKMPMLQQPGQLNQWHSSPQQRIPTPGPQSPFPRVAGTPDSPNGPPPQWNVRPLSQSPQSPVGQSQVSYVQVVNSKTKTALANLLSNRLQGNAGPESNNSTPISSSSALSTTTTTIQAMCPPPVTSQSLPHSAPTTTQSNVLAQRRTLVNITNGCKTIQVNSFGAARIATSSSQPSPTLPVAPPRPQFYGHDPQIKVPHGAQFLGCVFWATAGVHPSCGWRRAVEGGGGSAVDVYSSAVTHVIADFCRFPEFPQAVREGKRFVSAFWLNDVVERQVMVPPYQAFHLPGMYPRNPLPLADHVFSTTNFPSKDKVRLVKVLKILGANFTSYFTKLNTCLLCNKPEGLKYQKAREWKVPVVNAQFVSELYLGHVNAMQMMHSPKYQCFNPDQSMRLDYTLAPHLMACWKIPLRVTPEAIENYRTLKRTALEKLDNESSAKRSKMENGSSYSTSTNSDMEIDLDIDTEPLSPVTDLGTCDAKEKSDNLPPPLPVEINTAVNGQPRSPGGEKQLDNETKPEKMDIENLPGEAIRPETSENLPSNDPTEKSNGASSSVETPDKKDPTADGNIEIRMSISQAFEIGAQVAGDPGKTLADKMDAAHTENSKPLDEDSASIAKQDNSMEVEKVPGKDDPLKSRYTGVSYPSLPPIVMVSGFTRIYKDKIKSKIEKLGGAITTDWAHATHLVIKEKYITTKMFFALCRFKHIVTVYWVYESLQIGKFVDERKFGVRLAKFENQYHTTLSEVLAKPNRQYLFKGVTFFITPGDWLLKKDVECIIEAAGGTIDKSLKSLRHMRDYCSRFPKRSVIITSNEDFCLMQDFLMEARRPHVINVYTEDFVWQCIASQTVKLRQTTS